MLDRCDRCRTGCRAARRFTHRQYYADCLTVWGSVLAWRHPRRTSDCLAGGLWNFVSRCRKLRSGGKSREDILDFFGFWFFQPRFKSRRPGVKSSVYSHFSGSKGNASWPLLHSSYATFFLVMAAELCNTFGSGRDLEMLVQNFGSLSPKTWAQNLIRGREVRGHGVLSANIFRTKQAINKWEAHSKPVSYTHLTLPTKRIV